MSKSEPVRKFGTEDTVDLAHAIINRIGPHYYFVCVVAPKAIENLDEVSTATNMSKENMIKLLTPLTNADKTIEAHHEDYKA